MTTHYIQITIGTDAILKKHHPKLCDEDKNNPTAINHKHQYMVVSYKGEMHGQLIDDNGKANLTFGARQGDYVKWSMTSEYNNFTNPCMIYKIERSDQTCATVLDQLEGFWEPNHPTFLPASADEGHLGGDVLPPFEKRVDFWGYNAHVFQDGTESYYVKFVLRDTEKQEFRYFYWDPKIVVYSPA